MVECRVLDAGNWVIHTPLPPLGTLQAGGRQKHSRGDSTNKYHRQRLSSMNEKKIEWKDFSRGLGPDSHRSGKAFLSKWCYSWNLRDAEISVARVGREGHAPQRPWPWKDCGALTSPREAQQGWSSLPQRGGRDKIMPGLSGWIGIWNSEEQRKETGRCWDLSLFLKESYKQGLPFAHFLILPSILIYNRCLTHVLNCTSVLQERCFRNCV